MDNHDTRAAWRFHNATKYTLVGAGEGDEDILMGTPPDLGPAIGEQDPTIEPYPYKVYTTLDPWYLPREFPPSAIPALDALATTGDLPLDRAVPSLDAIAQLCLLSNGILKRGSHRTGRVVEYRVAGGTGARYHLELYLVCGDLPGIDAGVYHYAAHDHSLRRLRAGDHRAEIHQATGDEPSIARAPAIIAATSTFWRNAWRYQNRAYRRHCQLKSISGIRPPPSGGQGRCVEDIHSISGAKALFQGRKYPPCGRHVCANPLS